MIINKNGENLVISSGKNTVKLDGGIVINDFVINEPGEYEVAGIEAERLDGLVVLRLEGVTLGYFTPASATLTKEQIKECGDIEVAIFADDDKVYQIIKQLEPPIILPLNGQRFQGKTDVLVQKIGKISRGDIEPEKQKIILLQ